MKRETKTYWIDIQGKINNRLDAWETDLGAVARPRVLVPESLHEEFENEWTLADALAYICYGGGERSPGVLPIQDSLAALIDKNRSDLESDEGGAKIVEYRTCKFGGLPVSKDNLSKEKIFQNGASKYVTHYPKIPKDQLNIELMVFIDAGN